MEGQPQNPELRNNPENFHLCMFIICYLLAKFFCQLSSILSLILIGGF